MATAEAVVTRSRTPRILSPAALVRASLKIGGAFAFLAILGVVLNFSLLDGAFWSGYADSFRIGIITTLRYVVMIIPISVAIGFGFGWMRISRFRTLSWPIAVYVDFFRGVPPIVVVIYAAIFGSAFLSFRFTGKEVGLTAAAIALAFHSGAYQAEIFRAGFQSVPRGQLDAALAVGLRSGQAMRHVVFPQALRLSLPPLGNELAAVIKDSSLLAVLGALDLFGVSQDFIQSVFFIPGASVFWLLTMWTAVALAYFVMTTAVSQLLLFFERKYHVRGLEAISV
jgi:His/Glu/Gln/Arg/opine family amino acid ABC transporter permease subunit